MTNPAALPLFGDAYLADTQHLSLEEHGAYLKLLIIAWRSPNGALPDDDRRIATMLGCTAKKWATLRPAVMAFWTRTEHGWEQKRLSKERRYVAKKSEQNRDAAEARWSGKPRKTKEPVDANAHADSSANGYAPPPPPLSTSTEVGDNPESEKKPTNRELAFAGRVIRLGRDKYREWRRTYHAIPDFDAELASIDEWLADNPDRHAKWVFQAKGSLNRRHQEWLLKSTRRPSADEMVLPC